jgi:ABC-2 type transport system ATP-binding protein
LKRAYSDQTEVLWTQAGQRHVHAGSNATAFAQQLLAQHPDGISDLEIRPASLEEAYMNIVQKHEPSTLSPRG